MRIAAALNMLKATCRASSLPRAAKAFAQFRYDRQCVSLVQIERPEIVECTVRSGSRTGKTVAADIAVQLEPIAGRIAEVNVARETMARS